MKDRVACLTRASVVQPISTRRKGEIRHSHSGRPLLVQTRSRRRRAAFSYQGDRRVSPQTLFDRPLRRDPILVIWFGLLLLIATVSINVNTEWHGNLEAERVNDTL